MVDRMSYKRAAYEYDATDDASLDDSDERDEDNNQGQHDYHPEDNDQKGPNER